MNSAWQKMLDIVVVIITSVVIFNVINILSSTGYYVEFNKFTCKILLFHLRFLCCSPYMISNPFQKSIYAFIEFLKIYGGYCLFNSTNENNYVLTFTRSPDCNGTSSVLEYSWLLSEQSKSLFTLSYWTSLISWNYSKNEAGNIVFL